MSLSWQTLNASVMEYLTFHRKEFSQNLSNKKRTGLPNFKAALYVFYITDLMAFRVFPRVFPIDHPRPLESPIIPAIPRLSQSKGFIVGNSSRYILLCLIMFYPHHFLAKSITF